MTASSTSPYRRTSADDDLTKPAAQNRYSWRVVDIVVAAILGVACGLLYWAYDVPGAGWFTGLDAVTPGLGGLLNGTWLLAGVLGGVVIRKPGAAIFVELVAATVEAVTGSQWGVSNIWIGIAQGIGAELVLLVFLYKKFSLPVSVLAGAVAGVGCWAYSFISGGYKLSLTYNVIYLACTVVSGAFLAGLLGYVLMRLLARTGALSRFAAGRS